MPGRDDARRRLHLILHTSKVGDNYDETGQLMTRRGQTLSGLCDREVDGVYIKCVTP